MQAPLIDVIAADKVGRKVIEMADRLLTANKVVPGSVAQFGLTLDGTKFDVVLKVAK